MHERRLRTSLAYEPAVESKPPPPLPEIEPFSAPAPASGDAGGGVYLAGASCVGFGADDCRAEVLGGRRKPRAEAEQLTAAADAKLIAALTALDLETSPAREALLEGREYLSAAIALDGGNDQRSQLAANIEQELQEVLSIQPLYRLTTPLVTFSPEATPACVIDGGIYILMPSVRLFCAIATTPHRAPYWTPSRR